MVPIKVLIYDDNPDRRESLSALLSVADDMICVGDFPDCSTISEELKELQPDIVLMDIDMPNINGIEGLKIVRRDFPGIKVLMQTVFEQNEKIFECIRLGAAGYILKTETSSKILEGIREICNGGATMTSSVALKVLQFFREDPESAFVNKESFSLSEREIEVLKLLADGNSYKMIAAKLFISYYTVNAHLKRIYDKLQVHSAGEAVAIALRKKIV